MNNRPGSAWLGETDQAQFVRRYGDIFEQSPWVAARAFESGPFSDVAGLHAAMVRVVDAATVDEKLALLRAHPELAGREARAGTLTAASTSEQAGAGLNALTQAELALVARLNTAYRDKFGFPFIVAVRRLTKTEILDQWQRRLTNDRPQEFDASLTQVFVIARLRLEAMFGSNSR